MQSTDYEEIKTLSNNMNNILIFATFHVHDDHGKSILKKGNLFVFEKFIYISSVVLYQGVEGESLT